MTLFISENKRNSKAVRNAAVYGAVTAFCILIFLIYDQFSHGVRSPYMTFLFCWPLCLGLLPSIISCASAKIREQGIISANLYHSGTAALTVSSLLRGIFEIAGNASDYQQWLMTAGWLFLLGGIAAYLLKR